MLRPPETDPTCIFKQFSQDQPAMLCHQILNMPDSNLLEKCLQVLAMIGYVVLTVITGFLAFLIDFCVNNKDSINGKKFTSDAVSATISDQVSFFTQHALEQAKTRDLDSRSNSSFENMKECIRIAFQAYTAAKNVGATDAAAYLSARDAVCHNPSVSHHEAMYITICYGVAAHFSTDPTALSKMAGNETPLYSTTKRVVASNLQHSHFHQYANEHTDQFFYAFYTTYNVQDLLRKINQEIAASPFGSYEDATVDQIALKALQAVYFHADAFEQAIQSSLE